MTISSTSWSTLLLSCLWSTLFFGQRNFTSYWQPQVAINYPVSQNYSHNFALIHRMFLVDEGVTKFRGRQLDLAHFSNLDLRENQSLALGIQYRFRDVFENNENELRFTQQYNVTHKPLVVRLGHRFRAEQRIIGPSTIHRFRYRFATDFPLQGEKLDLGEPFLACSLEKLLSAAKSEQPEYDVRLNAQIGWRLDKGLNLQMGIEYRLEDYGAQNPDNVLFFLTSAQWSLK
ncbi:DUF2490 domain-containing protein [Flagellimonas meishanensis]|uniref:DUF2490 domain-containing protein n=1 Tax=Flagellimonas meishanensis TaxID=2873264 RepID=UPI001CA6FC2A|nr:DUF2490 domain-containing protein [[Muricauda] meishanensis]